MKNSISSIFENSHYDYKEIIISKNIETELMTIAKCQNCENHTNFSLNIDEKNKTSQKNANIKLKKFKNIEEQIDLKKINNDFGRCVCGMRHLDIAMAHVLKIMIEKNIPLRKHTLRDGPIPLLTLFTSNPNKHDYVGKDSLVILHPQLKTNVANIIVKEVDEVKGVLKGYPNDTVGIKDTDSEAITYELLAGSDIRCDIVKIPRNNFIENTNNKIIENTNNKIIKNTNNKLIENTSKTSLKKETIETNEEKIAINKIQHLTYLEFAPSIENKVKKLDDYLKSENIMDEKLSKLSVLDGTCGNGTLGIFLLKKGVKNVIFNDIWKPATFMTSVNLEANGFKTEILIDFNNIFDINKNNKNNADNENNNKNNEDNENNNIIASGNNFKVYNLAIENLKDKLSIKNENKFDICVLDCFPGENTDNFEKIANSLANNVLII